jgi:hypothetical protein
MTARKNAMTVKGNAMTARKNVFALLPFTYKKSE